MESLALELLCVVFVTQRILGGECWAALGSVPAVLWPLEVVVGWGSGSSSREEQFLHSSEEFLDGWSPWDPWMLSCHWNLGSGEALPSVVEKAAIHICLGTPSPICGLARIVKQNNVM